MPLWSKSKPDILHKQAGRPESCEEFDNLHSIVITPKIYSTNSSFPLGWQYMPSFSGKTFRMIWLQLYEE